MNKLESKFKAKNFIDKIASFFYPKESLTEENTETTTSNKNETKEIVNIYEKIREEESKETNKTEKKQQDKLAYNTELVSFNLQKQKISEMNPPKQAVELKSVQEIQMSLPKFNKNKDVEIKNSNYIKIKAGSFIEQLKKTDRNKQASITAKNKKDEIEIVVKTDIKEKEHRVLLNNMSKDDFSLLQKFKEKAIELQTQQKMEEEKLHPVTQFNIYTDKMLMGIIIPNSRKSIIVSGNNKANVIDFMEEYSCIKYSKEYNGNVLNFEDISITATFNDKGILDGLEFGEKFIGATVKGLKIGDNLEKVNNLYGEAKKKLDDTLIWGNFQVIVENDIVVKMKIHL